MNFAHGLHIVIAIKKFTDILRGDFFWWRGGDKGKGIMWGDLFMEEYFIGEEACL